MKWTALGVSIESPLGMKMLVNGQDACHHCEMDFLSCPPLASKSVARANEASDSRSRLVRRGDRGEITSLNDLTELHKMDEQTGGELPIRKEKRRGSRFPVVVLVEAKWQAPGGQDVKETAHATEVSAFGGLLDMKTYPRIGSELELTNPHSGEVAQARIVGTRLSKEDPAVLRVAVELLTWSETFWGLNFQIRKTSAELVKIEQEIKAGGIEPRILEEFRDSVDYVRKAAWAVQEWQERQLQKHDPQTVLPLITAERIRRATQLSIAITTDLMTHEVTRETTGMHEFFMAVENLYPRVADLFRGP